MENKYILIMAGGSGTRFWPRSRSSKPKQYLNIFGERSLLQLAVDRFLPIVPTENIFVVSGKNQAEVLEQQTSVIPRKNLIYEPVGRNTLPAIGLAAMWIDAIDRDGIMVVSPSDQFISNEGLFCDTVQSAVELASSENGIVTIGITPSFPATGYGYVRTGGEIDPALTIRRFKVDRFVEKPDANTAERYLTQGGYYWNSGMFVFKTSVFLDSLMEFAPGLYRDLRRIQSDIGTLSYSETLNAIYPGVDNISVDFGIMEHAGNLFMVEGNFPWNDLGNWESVYLFSEKDENGNSVTGETILIDTSGSYVYPGDELIAVIGLDNVVVVRNGNATLVCHRDRVEDVKKVVDILRQSGRSGYL